MPHVENNGIVGHRPHIGANPARVAAYRQTCCVAKYAKVHEAVNEALKLEALARLRTSHFIALLHYSPVQQTCEGEPLEIYPFVGSAMPTNQTLHWTGAMTVLVIRTLVIGSGQ